MKTAICVLAVLAACGGNKTGDPGGGSGAAETRAKPTTPIAIAYGDCAAATTTFVSGPRPRPFDPTQTADATDPGSAGSGSGSGSGSGGDPKAGILGDPALKGGAFASLTGGGTAGPADIGGLVDPKATEISGGFGYGGRRVDDLGSIGTGRVGLLGHGAGTGQGYGIGVGRGGMRAPSHPVPTTSIGVPTAQGGDLDKAIIRRYIKRNINKIQYCYEKQLIVKPYIAGTIAAKFVIADSGSVTSASATGFDADVASCVSGVIKDIEFPKPKDAKAVSVTYPFTFRPVDWSGTQTPPPGQPPKAPPVAIMMKVPPADAAPAPPPPAPPSDKPYVPGETNPLRAQDAALGACVAQAKSPYGAVVVELTYGATTTATAYGVDPATAACIATAAKAIARPAGDAKPQRCGFAFGAQSAADVPTIDITADAIRIGGKDVAKIAVLNAQVSTGFKIDALAAALPAPKMPPEVVELRAPFELRPADAAPMGIVTRTAQTVLDADQDLYFATMRGGTWKPFVAVTFPQVPVPRGTGRGWSAAKPAGHTADERVVMSLLVSKTSYWIGLSRVNEFYEIKRDTPDAAAHLAEALQKQKETAFFADRTDVEIAGESAVTWGEVVAVIDAATKVGFLDWMLADPAALSAHPEL